MKTGETRSLTKFACGPCVAFLALSLTFGVSAVRADSETPAPSLQEMFLNPIMDLVHGVEARLASLETTVASLAGSSSSRQITSPELCIADQTGAQTCITKAQLDRLLVVIAHNAAAEPATAVVEAIETPAVTESAVIEPAIAEPAVIQPAIAEPAAIERAAAGPAGLETTGQADAPAAAPEDTAAALGIVPSNDEPVITGSLTSAVTGFAFVWHPQVETTIAGLAFSAE
jgi:hypothetical protein